MPCPFTRCCTGFLPAIPQTLLSSPQKRASETLALQHVDNSFHFVRAGQAVPFHAMLRPVPTGDPSNAAQLSAEKSQRDAGATTCRQQFSLCKGKAGRALSRDVAPGSYRRPLKRCSALRRKNAAIRWRYNTSTTVFTL